MTAEKEGEEKATEAMISGSERQADEDAAAVDDKGASEESSAVKEIHVHANATAGEGDAQPQINMSSSVGLVTKDEQECRNLGDELEKLLLFQSFLLPLKDLSLPPPHIPSGLIPFFGDPVNYYSGHDFSSLFEVESGGSLFRIKENVKEFFGPLDKYPQRKDVVGKEFGLMSFICDHLYVDRIFYMLVNLPTSRETAWPEMVFQEKKLTALMLQRRHALESFLEIRGKDGPSVSQKSIIEEYLQESLVSSSPCSAFPDMDTLLQAYQCKLFPYPVVVLQSVYPLSVRDRFCCKKSAYSRIGGTEFLSKGPLQHKRSPVVILRHERISPCGEESIFTADLLLPPPHENRPQPAVCLSHFYPTDQFGKYTDCYEYSLFFDRRHPEHLNLQVESLTDLANPNELHRLHDRQLADHHFHNSYSLERAIVSVLLNPCGGHTVDIKYKEPFDLCRRMFDTMQSYVVKFEKDMPENTINPSALAHSSDFASITTKLTFYSRMLSRRIVLMSSCEEDNAVMVQAPPVGHLTRWPILFIAVNGVKPKPGVPRGYLPVYSVRPSNGLSSETGEMLNSDPWDPANTPAVLDMTHSFDYLKLTTSLPLAMNVRGDIDQCTSASTVASEVSSTFFDPSTFDKLPPAAGIAPVRVQLYQTFKCLSVKASNRFMLTLYTDSEKTKINVLRTPVFCKPVTCKAFALPTLIIGQVILNSET